MFSTHHRTRARAMSSPEREFERLLDGHRAFRRAHFAASDGATDVPRALRALSERGQRPRALVVACSDSRADPAIVFDTGPGDVFTIRNVGSLVPAYAGLDGGHHGTCAATEYATVHLEVPVILVMGHTQCGGAAAGLRKYGNGPDADASVFGVNETTGEGFIGAWVALAEDAVRRVCERHDPGVRARMLEYVLVRQSVQNLLTFPFVKRRVDRGELVVKGAVFNVWDGTLEVLRADGSFEQLDDDAEDARGEAKRAKN